MTQVQTERTTTTDLWAFAKEIFEMCNENYEEAERQMRLRLMRDPERWLEVLAWETSNRMIRSLRTTKRATLSQPQGLVNRALPTLIARVESVLDWPLSTGKLLRHATPEEVLCEADRLLSQAKAAYETQGRRCELLRKIAVAVPSGLIIGDCLSDAEAAVIQRSVFN